MIDYVGDLTECETSSAIDGIRRPHAYVKYNDFVSFFLLILKKIFLAIAYRSNRASSTCVTLKRCGLMQIIAFWGLVDVRMH
jgi:hypothetical protein